MSMLGHYVRLFEEIGLVKTTPLKGERHPLEKTDLWVAAGGWKGPWDYSVEKISGPNGCIHVGAWDCAEMGCYVTLFGDNVHWVEANSYTYNNIAKPRVDVYNQKIYNFAALDQDNLSLVLNIPEKADCSSLLNSNIPVFQPVRTETVKTKTLDTLIKEESIDMTKIDFLNIDTEGAEYQVLEGMKENLKYINYLFIEVALYQRFDGMVVFNDMIRYLSARGLELHRCSSMNDGWGDAFFVRK